MTINGVAVGDPLADNNYVNDGFRFHDGFHLTHAAILGCSPVLRMLLKRRRSNPLVRRREDGAWGVIVEEGIVAMVFSWAQHGGLLELAEHVNVQMLERISEMTSRLEVSVHTPDEWALAIINALQAWKQIYDRKGGEVELHLVKRRIELV